jgi:two-component system invasion response regulator UvrY
MSSERTLKVLIVDDHAVVRQGVRQILSGYFEKALVGEAKDAEEMLEMLRKGKWDALILDIGLPGRSGLDVLDDIKKMHPKLPVLALSAYPEDQLAIRVLKSGASGYLSKESASEELVNALRKVIAGGRYVSTSLAERLAMTLEDSLDKLPHETLSDREYQIMCMLASGKTTTEIAKELLLSPTTVSTYRARVFRKLHLRKRSELVQYALHHGLIH